MKEAQKNAVVTATKVNGFINLVLSVEGVDSVKIKVNDFGGKEKKSAKALTFKIYKALGGK